MNYKTSNYYELYWWEENGGSPDYSDVESELKPKLIDILTNFQDNWITELSDVDDEETIEATRWLINKLYHEILDEVPIDTKCKWYLDNLPEKFEGFEKCVDEFKKITKSI